MYKRVAEFFNTKSMLQRYFIALTIIVITGVTIRNTNEYLSLDAEIEEEALHHARNVMEVINAYKKAYEKIVSEGDMVLDHSTYRFIPEHTVNLIKDAYEIQKGEELFIRNIANNAANPENLPTPDEMTLLERFQHDRSQQLLTTASFNARSYYVLSQPIYVKPVCLMCHGKREDAPEFVRQHNKGGFDYQVGDLRAVTAVYVDRDAFKSESVERYYKRAIASSITALLVIFLLFLAVKKISKKEESLIRLLKDASSKDALTSIANRRKLDQSIKKTHHLLQKEGKPYTLLLIDIDFFKVINDTYGHLVGDGVLVEMAGLFRANIRNHDILGRWGGEEFLVILPGAEEHAGASVAEKIRSIVDLHQFVQAGHVTISCGVYGVMERDSIDVAISRVDKALYLAKNSGRNRVSRFEKQS